MTDTAVRPPREDLYRAQPSLELVRSENGEGPVLAGYGAVFNTWAEINSVWEGRFLERIAPGAFTKTITEGRDKIKILFNHGHDPQIGTKPLGSIRSLNEDTTGLRYEVSLFDTAYNRDLIPGLEAGVYGSSFRFSVVREKFTEKPKRSTDNPEGLPERTLLEVRMPELGPVTFPAYAKTTAGLRSLTDEFLLGRFVDDPDRLLELVQALRERREKTPEFSDDAIPVLVFDDNRAEPEPSEATTQPPEKPERSVATTPRPQINLYTGQKEQEAWRL